MLKKTNNSDLNPLGNAKRSSLVEKRHYLYLSLVEQSQDAIYLLYGNKLEYINRRFSELFNVTTEEACSDDFDVLTLIAPESRKLIKSRMKNYINGKNSSPNYEFTAIAKDGRIIEIESSISYVPYKGGRAVQGVLRDITDRKRATEKLALINNCFLNFTSNPVENMQRLTELFGYLMGSTCALYNRLHGGMLCAFGQWHTPGDFNSIDIPAGHICYDLIKSDNSQPVIIKNLQNTVYASTDPNVSRYGLETYVGQAVKRGEKNIGAICAVYQKDYHPDDQEMNILGIVAAALSVEENRHLTETMLQKREEELAIKSANLEEINTALKVLLSRREQEISEIEKMVLVNIRTLVSPYIEKLQKSNLNSQQKTLIDILEKNIDSIASPFLRDVSSAHLNMTPQQISVAHLVKDGKTSKEISEILNISVSAVNFHRDGIRKKLGLLNKKTNLRSYLLTLP